MHTVLQYVNIVQCVCSSPRMKNKGHLKIKVKVSHRVIAVGVVWVRGPLYLGYSWWKAESITLLSLPYPSLIRQRYPFAAGHLTICENTDQTKWMNMFITNLAILSSDGSRMKAHSLVKAPFPPSDVVVDLLFYVHGKHTPSDVNSCIIFLWNFTIVSVQ